jgi:hypothetical protein
MVVLSTQSVPDCKKRGALGHDRPVSVGFGVRYEIEELAEPVGHVDRLRHPVLVLDAAGMPSWSEFATATPELAATVRTRLDATRTS